MISPLECLTCWAATLQIYVQILIRSFFSYLQKSFSQSLVAWISVFSWSQPLNAQRQDETRSCVISRSVVLNIFIAANYKNIMFIPCRFFCWTFLCERFIVSFLALKQNSHNKWILFCLESWRWAKFNEPNHLRHTQRVVKFAKEFNIVSLFA